MKKYIYLLTSCFVLCQSAQAMEIPTFERFEDEDGFQAVCFKKTEDEFNPDIEKFVREPASRNIQKIYFEEGISYEDQKKVYDTVGKKLKLYQLGNTNTYSFLVNYREKEADISRLKQINVENGGNVDIYFYSSDKVNLNLRNLRKSDLKYLPFFRKIVNGMNNVESVHFGDIQQKDAKLLSLMITRNPKIQNVTFTGISDPYSHEVIIDLLMIPKKINFKSINYYFANFSVDYLDAESKKYSLETIQNHFPKTVYFSLLPGERVFEARCYNVCKHPVYGEIFKASYPNNKKGEQQRELLLKVLNLQDGNPLRHTAFQGIPDGLSCKMFQMDTWEERQDKLIDYILCLDRMDERALPIYYQEFLNISKILGEQIKLTKTKQNNEVSVDLEYDQLEQKKIDLIKEMVDRLS
ncbi:MAG: hypothetical protein H0X26_05650 [Alphaproteobacteria bacterium]|nr:hypothetical protein [Alphaproteobacteria bacterium]